jgi:hypothetical protein
VQQGGGGQAILLEALCWEGFRWQLRGSCPAGGRGGDGGGGGGPVGPLGQLLRQRRREHGAATPAATQRSMSEQQRDGRGVPAAGLRLAPRCQLRRQRRRRVGIGGRAGSQGGQRPCVVRSIFRRFADLLPVLCCSGLCRSLLAARALDCPLILGGRRRLIPALAPGQRHALQRGQQRMLQLGSCLGGCGSHLAPRRGAHQQRRQQQGQRAGQQRGRRFHQRPCHQLHHLASHAPRRRSLRLATVAVTSLHPKKWCVCVHGKLLGKQKQRKIEQKQRKTKTKED